MGWQDAPAVSGNKWESAPTFEQAKRNQNARQALEALEASGELRPAEQQALEALRGSEAEDAAEISKTNATYRGFTHDLMLGQRDTLSGVASYLKGDGYTAGRDASRAKDQAAYEAHPEEFSKGQAAGSGALAGGTMTMGAPILQGANWLTKALAGGFSGTAIGFNQAVQNEQIKGTPPESLEDYARVFKENLVPIAGGGAIGGAAYPVAATAGATMRSIGGMVKKPLPGMGRKSSSMLRKTHDAAAISGQDIRQYLDSLSDEAMLVDVPEFRAIGQGLAAQGGPGGKELARAIRQRQETNGQRITADMNRHIDGPDAAFTQRRANATERASVWGPEYDAALDSGERVGTDRIAELLMRKGQDAVGAPAATMRRVGKDLGVNPALVGPQAPVSAVRAHNVRSNLRDEISAAAQSGLTKFSPQVSPVLNELDAALDQVPGYAQARTGYANNRAMDDAIQFGADALDSGRKTAVSPTEFAEQFGAMSDAQKDAVGKGLRSQVARIMGTSRNDAAAAWGEFAKDWNEQKLRLVLGDKAADPLIKRLRSEQVFSETNGAINAGSQTDFRTAARKALEPIKDQTTGQQIGPLRRIKTALLDRPGNALADSLIYGPRAARANQELGQALGASNASRDAIVQALMKQGGTGRKPGPDAISRIIQVLLHGGGAATSSQLITNQ